MIDAEPPAALAAGFAGLHERLAAQVPGQPVLLERLLVALLSAGPPTRRPGCVW